MSLDRLLELLAEEKRNTPSNYALVVLSEGAKWQGYVPAFERYDASGHVRPPNITEALKTRDRRASGRGEHGQRPHLRAAKRRAGLRG